LTINNPDDGSFRIQFTSQELKRSVSGEMKTNMHENQIRDAMYSYFKSVNVSSYVKRYYYDAEGAETSDKSLATKIVFEIKIDRLTTVPTTSSMTVAKASSKSDIQLEANVQVSSVPMTGKWQIKCVYDDNTFALTEPLNLDASVHTIQRHISEHCPKMRNRILVSSYSSQYTHHSVGKEFYIEFKGYN
jgi:hypothetical protein